LGDIGGPVGAFVGIRVGVRVGVFVGVLVGEREPTSALVSTGFLREPEPKSGFLSEPALFKLSEAWF
jgi:hypothetical protein